MSPHGLPGWSLRPLTMFRGCRGRRDDVPAALFMCGKASAHLPAPPFLRNVSLWWMLGPASPAARAFRPGTSRTGTSSRTRPAPESTGIASSLSLAIKAWTRRSALLRYEADGNRHRLAVHRRQPVGPPLHHARRRMIDLEIDRTGIGPDRHGAIPLEQQRWTGRAPWPRRLARQHVGTTHVPTERRLVDGQRIDPGLGFEPRRHPARAGLFQRGLGVAP